MTELAIFDLDYTLTQKGTWGRFIARMMRGKLIHVPGLLWAAGWTQLQYQRGKQPRVEVKRAMMRQSILGLSKTVLENEADEFIADDLEGGMDERVLSALREHQEKGHHVLIASAAVDLLVDRYESALGVDGSVSTQMKWGQDDRLTDTFATENCYGPEKMIRIATWIKAQGLNPTRVTAYSDSASDAPLLEFADKAVMVRPSRKARRYAQRKGFEIWS
ncbi:MAG: HAD-IB family hydrolase [Pseudomonadota bacterium]